MFSIAAGGLLKTHSLEALTVRKIKNQVYFKQLKTSLRLQGEVSYYNLRRFLLEDSFEKTENISSENLLVLSLANRIYIL